jgi:hypothetical protein
MNHLLDMAIIGFQVKLGRCSFCQICLLEVAMNGLQGIRTLQVARDFFGHDISPEVLVGLKSQPAS